ncbi:hypothetical protein ABPG72_010909 [Tetrahymena utriculariae]
MNFEQFNNIQQRIITLINQINVFNDNVITSLDKNNNQKGQVSSSNNYNDEMSYQKIIKLNQNKTNFCSQELIQQLEELLKQFNPQLDKLKNINQIFINNQQPLEFTKIDNQEFSLIHQYTLHAQQLQLNQINYKNQITNSQPIVRIKQLIFNNNKSLPQTLNQSFESYLIQTYPFLNQIDFHSIYPTFSIQPLIPSSFSIQSNIQKLNIKLLKCKFKDTDKYLEINTNQNNQQELIQISYNGQFNSCVSDLILDRNSKYVFRFTSKKRY